MQIPLNFNLMDVSSHESYKSFSMYMEETDLN